MITGPPNRAAKLVALQSLSFRQKEVARVQLVVPKEFKETAVKSYWCPIWWLR